MAVDRESYRDATVFFGISSPILIFILLCFMLCNIPKIRLQQKLQNKDVINDKLLVIISSFTAVTFCFIGSILYMISTLTRFEYLEVSPDSKQRVNTQTGAVALWGLAYIALFVVFIGRLYFTFNGGRYEYSKRVFMALFIIVLISVIIFIIGIIGWHTKIIPGETLAILIIIGFIGDIVFCLTVIILFIKRLFQLILNRENDMLLQNDIDELNLAQLELIEYTTKFSLLTIFAIAHSLLCSILWGQYFSYGDEWNDTRLRIEYFAWWSLSWDLTVSGLCSALNLQFSHNLYKKLCICCHLSCQYICIKCAQQFIDKNKNDGVVMSNIDNNDIDNDDNDGGVDKELETLDNDTMR